MLDGAAFLDPAVVAATDDAALVDDYRANGDSALGQALAGFLDGGLHEGVHGCSLNGINQKVQSYPADRFKISASGICSEMFSIIQL
ncbi:hypothetical protein D3C78_1273920 [compost metagenome]